MEASSAPGCSSNYSRPKPKSRNGVRVVGKIREQSSTNHPLISMSKEDDYFIVSFHGHKDTYILDGCYDQDESTSTLFAHEVKPLLQGLLHGENCCVISYGDQGSGKSQLIQGSLETPGLAVMTFCEIFSSIEEVGGSIDISCYEMYNDHLYDLLEYKEQEIQVMEDTARILWLKGLSKIPVKSLSDFENFYFHTRNQQKFPQKAENDASVKSHKGLIMYITSVDKESKNSIVGKLNFMDLAGNEDVQKRVDAKSSIAECNKINKSLYALRNVVRALNGNERHIPYRESKLTQLLQDFLCNTNNSVLITCLSPTWSPHTLREFSMASKSCQFANREKQSRGYFLPSVPMEKTKRICGLGSSETKIKDSSSTFKGRFSSHESAIKKATTSLHWAKKTNLFNVGYPLSNTRKKEHLYNKKGSIGFNDIPIFDELKEGSIGFNDIPIFDELKEGSVGSNAISISGRLKEPDSYFDKNSPPTLTKQLRELSNRFKEMSSRCEKFYASINPKIPEPPLSSRVDNILLPEKCTTSHENFQTRSTGLKKTIVNECIDFLNTATMEELKQLKWIGEKRARYIIELREETSEPFKDIDDLKEIGLSSK